MYGRVAWWVPALLGNPIIGRLCGGGFFGLGPGGNPPARISVAAIKADSVAPAL